MDTGTFGACEKCHDEVEEDRLMQDPLICFCLDCLTDEQKRAHELDLELASRIQNKLLPDQNMDVNGWQIFHHYDPAGLVNGDFCDLIVPEQSDGDLYFLLGDVSGKGVAASLLMSQLHALFRSTIDPSVPLPALIQRVNQFLCEHSLSNHFATLVFGKADGNGDVEICNAGHCPPLLVRKDNITEIKRGGFPLGIFNQGEYAATSIHLDKGESLFCYSDGVTEAMNESRNEYGDERLINLIRTASPLPPRTLVETCLGDINLFRSGATKTDDLTIMVLQRTG